MTLTQAAILTKRSMIIFAVLVVVGLVSWLGYQYYYYAIYLPSIPPKVELPETKFGILPKPNLIEASASSSNYSYTLDTQTGELPTEFPNLIKVFFIPQNGTTLLASDRAKELAKKFNFNNGPELLSPTQYRFYDNSGGSMVVDLNTSNFRYQHGIATESAQIPAETLPSKEQIITKFKDFLSDKGLLKDQLTQGRVEVAFDNSSNLDSNTALISMWQNDVEKLPVITSNYNLGLVKGIVTKYPKEDEKYLILDYIYWPIDLAVSTTYPLKPVSAAFDDLQSGKASIVREPTKPRVSITDIFLAYVVSDQYSPYLQPVYVFTGPEFTALVPAISSEFLEQ